MFIASFVVEMHQTFIDNLDSGQPVEPPPEVLIFRSPSAKALVITAHFAIERPFYANATSYSVPRRAVESFKIICAAVYGGSKLIRRRLVEILHGRVRLDCLCAGGCGEPLEAVGQEVRRGHQIRIKKADYVALHRQVR